MYRWLTDWEHLTDNLQHGWLANERTIHFSLAASEELRRRFDEGALLAAGVASLPDGRLAVNWTGISLTSSGPEQFSSDNYGIFGLYGIRMTDAWVLRQQRATLTYISDDADDLQLLVDRVRNTTGDERRQALCCFDRFELRREAELRVFASAQTRIPFSCESDVAAIFVPEDSYTALLHSQFGHHLIVSVLPVPDCPDLPEGLWDSGEG